MPRLCPLFLLCALCACQKPFEAKLEAGDAAARAGRWEEARTRWTEATQLDPTSARAHSKLGFALWNLGLKDGAALAWTQANSLNPDAEDSLEGLARLDLEQRDAGAAVDRLQRLAKPASRSFRLLLAQALIARGGPGDADAALAALQRPELADPGDPQVDYLAGSAQMSLHRLSDAQETLEGLRRRHPQSPLGSYGLARLAAAQSRQTDALLHLTAARATAGSDWQPERVAADPAFGFLLGTPEFKGLVSK